MPLLCCRYKKLGGPGAYSECVSSSVCPSPESGYTLSSYFSVDDCNNCFRGGRVIAISDTGYFDDNDESNNQNKQSE